MRQQSNLTPILLATSSFIGGIAVGFLFSPRSGAQNRTWLSDHSSEFKGWLDQKRITAGDKSSKELEQFRKNVQQGIIPDLYEATENINIK